MPIISTSPCFVLFLRKERDSFSRWRLGRLVCAVVRCSGGVLLRNSNPCAYSQKVNAIYFLPIRPMLATLLLTSASLSPLRSPLDCGDRSNPLGRNYAWGISVFWGSVSGDRWRFFRKNRRQSVASRATCLRVAVVCCRKYLSLSDDCL